MKEEILAHLNEPGELEKLYRNNKSPFKREFMTIYPQVKGNAIADFWNARLNYENEEINWGTAKDLIFVLLAALVGGVIAKLPAILNIDEDFFYPRNIGFTVFPVLAFYFARKNNLSASKSLFISGTMLAGLLYINLLPDLPANDTLILAYLHLLLFLWFILGFAFVGEYGNNEERRLSFLKYNGDLVVMTTLIVISAGILSGITIGLFSLIGFNIEKFYFENIVKFGLPAAPILGTYLIRTNPQLVGKVSPVIAKIFSPLVLLMLVVYLGAIVYSGKDPYNDREFLLIFNALLIGVMAIIFFSVTEAPVDTKNPAGTWVLFLLSVITIAVNIIALSAIMFRMIEYGITPNRVAVSGGNLLILVNLILDTIQFLKIILNKGTITGVRRTITAYLPVYFIWTTIVTFIFPLIFGFK